MKTGFDFFKLNQKLKKHMLKFQDLNLSAKILSALENKGYTQPTDIQEQAIPHLLEGKDFLGIAQTGTGKTAAFALPILDNLAKNKKPVAPNSIRALILTPTRELASQIADNIKVYGKDLGLSHTVIFGGVSINNQVRDMQRGFDIVVATPGRLIDLMGRGCVKFASLEIFVLDEADRMLDMGFIVDVKRIIAKLPPKRQTLFFSATMPKDIASLANSILTNPVKVEITPQATTVEKIDQKINYVARENKLALLKSVLVQEDATSVLVFSKTKHGANRIVKFLEDDGMKVAAIHGNKSQLARERALGDFRRGKVSVLIATDIAARGIDIPAISHVINYDIPHDPENYVHRIGRTARAGREGIALSFCDSTERSFLKAIEKTIRYEIPVDETHAFHNAKISSSPKEFSQNRRISRGSAADKASARSNSTSSSRTGSGAPKTSYFGENRRRKDGSDDGRNHAKPRFSSDDRKPRFSSDRDGDKKPRFSSDRDNDRKPRFSNDRDNDRKPRFSSDKKEEKVGIFKKIGFAFGAKKEGGSESFGEKKKWFGDKERSGSSREGSGFGEKKRFGNDSRKPFGDRKPFGERGEKRERSSFGDDRKKSFGGSSSGSRFGAKKTFGDDKRGAFEDRPKTRFSGDFRKKEGDSSRSSFGEKRDRPSFGDRSEKREGSGFGDRRERPSFGDDRKKSFGENRFSRPSDGTRKPAFGGDKKRGFGFSKGPRFGARSDNKKTA